MYRNNDFIYDAAVQLEKRIAMPVTIESARLENDAILLIQNQQFTVTAKPELRSANKGLVIAQINELQEKTTRPVIIIAKFIHSDIALELKDREINYLDTAGNAFIKKDGMLIYISGQKTVKIEKTNQTRAFQEVGIKLIFSLLNNPDNLQLSYRELAEQTGIAIGSVSNVMKELEDLNFILKTDTKRILKNKPELLNRWIVAYNDVLRPKLLKKKMRFSNADRTNWSALPVNDVDGTCFWGGEPASAMLTGQFNPVKFTIYTDSNWQNIMRHLDLRPDDEGEVEVLQIFWKLKDRVDYSSSPLVPPLLVYADLISSGNGRNIEIAKRILDNELQNIK